MLIMRQISKFIFTSKDSLVKHEEVFTSKNSFIWH